YVVIVPARFGSRAAAPTVVERLKQIAKDVQFFPGHPMNTSELNELQEQLREVKDASRQVDLRMRLGNLLLLHGRNEEAIEYLNIQEWASKQGILPPQEVLHEENSLLAVAYLRLGEQENC